MSGELVTWIAPDGVETELDVEWNTKGRFAPPVQFEEEGVPGQPGARLRSVHHGVREFMLPIWIDSGSDTALRTDLRDLVHQMNPTRGDGKIRVQGATGNEREILCRYSTGLGLNESLGDNSGPTVQRAAVVFRAHNPYWQSTSDVVREFNTGVVPTFFPFFPFELTSSEVVADEEITVEGDVESWPVWKIHGPGSTIVLWNRTSGKKLELSDSGGFSLGAGEWLDIDTRPGKKTVVRSDGANIWEYVSPDSHLWQLLPGSNSVRLEMSGSNADSYLRLTYRPRYLTP